MEPTPKNKSEAYTAVALFVSDLKILKKIHFFLLNRPTKTRGFTGRSAGQAAVQAGVGPGCGGR